MRIRSEKGLTLVEIIVVLIILSLVMTFLASKILGAGDKAKADLNKLKMQDIKTSIEQFQLRYNTLPSSLESLIKCTQETGMDCVPITNDQALKDAWGTPFNYSLENNNRSYRIMSKGADGRDGGSGVDFDAFITGP